MPNGTNIFGISSSSSRSGDRVENSSLAQSTPSKFTWKAGEMSTNSYPQFEDDEIPQNDWGLHRAATKGDIEMIEFALQNGQSPNHIKDGISPLHSAAWSGNEACAKLLLAHGADVNIGSVQLAKQGSMVDLSNKTAAFPIGFTPLHLASLYGHTSIVRLLLDHGAHTSLLDRNGFTSASLAQWKGHTGIAELLHIWAATNANDSITDAPKLAKDNFNSSISSSTGSNRSKNKMSSSQMKRQKSIEQLSNAAAGVKASIQNGKKHVLNRVASQPSLQSSVSPIFSQDPMPPSPAITTFASSFARDLRSKASTVFNNDNQQLRTRQHRPSISSTFEKSSNSSEGFSNPLSQSTSALPLNSGGPKADGTIRKMMRNTSTHLSGLGIRPGKVRERVGKTDFRYDPEIPKSASYISSFYSSTDSLQLTNSVKEGKFPSFDDRARWEAMCDAQNRSTNSPLTVDFYVSNKSMQDVAGPNDLFGKGIFGIPSPMDEIEMTTQEDSQEMLERTTESYDLFSKHKLGFNSSSNRAKNALTRSWSADKAKDLPACAAELKTISPHKRHLTADQCAEAIFRGAEEGFEWKGEDGQPSTLREMLAAYGKALSREKAEELEQKEEKVNDAQMQLCALTLDMQRTRNNDQSIENGMLDVTALTSSIEATEDTSIFVTNRSNDGFVAESLTNSASSTTESALSCNTVKKDSDQDCTSSRPSYALLNEPIKRNEIYFSPPPRTRTSSLKNRRSSQYNPLPYKGSKMIGQREGSGRHNFAARDSGGSSSNASMASYATAV